MSNVDASVAKNSLVIRQIGVWGNFPTIFPHPQQLLGSAYSADEREAIARYIEQTPEARGLGVNPFITANSMLEDDIQLSLTPRCDGAWLYSDSLAYYVKKGVNLPEVFILHLRARGYSPPTESVDLRFHQCDYGGYWLIWAAKNVRMNWRYVPFLLCLLLLYPLRIFLWPFRRRIRPL